MHKRGAAGAAAEAEGAREQPPQRGRVARAEIDAGAAELDREFRGAALRARREAPRWRRRRYRAVPRWCPRERRGGHRRATGRRWRCPSRRRSCRSHERPLVLPRAVNGLDARRGRRLLELRRRQERRNRRRHRRAPRQIRPGRLELGLLRHKARGHCGETDPGDTRHEGGREPLGASGGGPALGIVVGGIFFACHVDLCCARGPSALDYSS